MGQEIRYNIKEMQEVLGSENYGIRHFVAYGYRIRLRPDQQSDAWPRIFDSLTRRVLSVLALFNFPVGTLIGFAILYRGRRGLRSTRGRLTKGRRASNQRNFDNCINAPPLDHLVSY